MNKKRLLILTSAILILVASAITTGFFINRSRKIHENEQILNGIIVDVLYDTIWVVYTEDLKPGHTIVTVSTQDDPLTPAEIFQVHQSIHVIYEGYILDRSPGSLSAKEITLNTPPEKEALKKAVDYYESFCKRTGFRQTEK